MTVMQRNYVFMITRCTSYEVEFLPDKVNILKHSFSVCCIYFSLLPLMPAGVQGSNETPPPLSVTGQPRDGAPAVVHVLQFRFHVCCMPTFSSSPSPSPNHPPHTHMLPLTERVSLALSLTPTHAYTHTHTHTHHTVIHQLFSC